MCHCSKNMLLGITFCFVYTHVPGVPTSLQLSVMVVCDLPRSSVGENFFQYFCVLYTALLHCLDCPFFFAGLTAHYFLDPLVYIIFPALSLCQSLFSLACSSMQWYNEYNFWFTKSNVVFEYLFLHVYKAYTWEIIMLYMKLDIYESNKFLSYSLKKSSPYSSTHS